MRNVLPDRVLLTVAARALINEDDLRLAGSVPVVILSAGGGAHQADQAGGTAVFVGAAAEDARTWRPVAPVYVHVGDMGDLPAQIGVTIPMTGQGASGVRNVLRWAGAHAVRPQPWAQHTDIVTHARHCAEQYREPEHVRHAEEHCSRAAEDVSAAFPEVVAVLGTGFPFYCMIDAADAERAQVPSSIQHYTATQEEFFARKLLPQTGMPRPAGTWTATELASAGIDVAQTSFNAYEYTRHGVEPPSAPERGTLAEFVKANTCSAPDRLWPCHLCTSLHDPAKYPEQAWIRDFMPSCLRCGQTPFLPRAVGVLGSDIDLVAVVHDGVDRGELTDRVAAWIDEHPRYYRHDTRWEEQLGAEHGPLDVFVTTSSAFLNAATRMGSESEWMGVTVPASVTWLPVSHIDYEVGKYLPLCMELLQDHTPHGEFQRELSQLRRKFAERVTSDAILAAYRSDSEYLRQLASNASIDDLLRRRLERWRSGPPSVGALQ